MIWERYTAQIRGDLVKKTKIIPTTLLKADNLFSVEEQN